MEIPSHKCHKGEIGIYCVASETLICVVIFACIFIGETAKQLNGRDKLIRYPTKIPKPLYPIPFPHLSSIGKPRHFHKWPSFTFSSAPYNHWLFITVKQEPRRTHMLLLTHHLVIYPSCCWYQNGVDSMPEKVYVNTYPSLDIHV